MIALHILARVRDVPTGHKGTSRPPNVYEVCNKVGKGAVIVYDRCGD